MRPVLGVALMAPAPTKDTTPATAGSFNAASAKPVCNDAMRGMDALCAASVTATITPVSCNGKKPLGVTTYSATVPNRVPTATSSTSPWCRRATRRVRRYSRVVSRNPRSNQPVNQLGLSWGRRNLPHIMGSASGTPRPKRSPKC